MGEILLVGVGGFLGAISRAGVAKIIHFYFNQFFPISTLIVNVAGCFAIGLLFEYLREHHLLPTISLFLAVGFLGSFTTFSAFGFETIQLIRNNNFYLALINVCINLIFCFSAVFFGSWIGSALKI